LIAVPLSTERRLSLGDPEVLFEARGLPRRSRPV